MSLADKLRPMNKAGAVDRLLGAQLKRLREERGVSQQALAQASGLDALDLISIEAGVRHAAAGELFTITQALGVSVATLWADLKRPLRDEVREAAEELDIAVVGDLGEGAAPDGGLHQPSTLGGEEEFGRVIPFGGPQTGKG